MRALLDRYRADAEAGRLAFQSCRACGANQAFLRPFCQACGSEDIDWRHAAGGGTVAAHSVLHRAPTPDYRAKVPYAIALVDLDEGVRVMTHADLDLSVGQRVALSFAPHEGAEGTLHLPRVSAAE
ncbi:MAG: OB-fold domain-containing protein [Alphaproteobacteria bacterium]|nr:OB-fold domain-containing protein [Alphaproteobacteria bacterium]MDX5368202.1 OB-fold domain-containing protein [Alphaproteobacteria bacterium]MDX5463014.1 OB-fold domain-containing protein [Alphaproteobacteria bacterium]